MVKIIHGLISYLLRYNTVTFSLYLTLLTTKPSHEPHATAVKKFTEWSGEGSAFVEWTDQSNSINWTEALKQLKNPTFYHKKE